MTSATLNIHRAASDSSTHSIVRKASDELFNSLLMLSPVFALVGLMLCFSRVDAVVLRSFAAFLAGMAAIVVVRYFTPSSKEASKS